MSDLPNEYLLRFEGVNLAAVLDDTNEISIRRGASLMLRQAVKEIENEIDGLEAISEGASIGLFRFSGTDADAPVNAVAKHLNTRFPHLTFVVDSAPMTEGFLSALETVTAKNRFRQFRQLTLVTPTRIDGALCCEIDRVRPALTKADQQNIKGERASRSALDRFLFGRDSRASFYRRELGVETGYRFTDKLDELAEPASGQDFGNLNGKLAIIYCDGNKFGQKQRRCASPGELRAFDTCVQAYRQAFLRDLLDGAVRDPGFMSDACLRLETLLWGGDEMLFVVPAWRGLATLQRFYEVSAEWTFEGTPLTHASGIVFCHHKIPISQVIRTAIDLADEVKRKAGDCNRFDYLVLESISYPTQKLHHFRELRYGPDVECLRAPLAPFTGTSATPWIERVRYLAAFLETLPRSALHEITQLWVAYRATHDEDERNKRIEQFEQRVRRMLDISGQDMRSRLQTDIFHYFLPEDLLDGQDFDHIGWLHLTELWDYLAPV